MGRSLFGVTEPYLQERSGEVRSDAKGVYRLPPLPPARLTVTVIAQHWAPALRKIEITPDNPAVDFRLQPGKTLRLRFVDDSGKPVPEVYVGIEAAREQVALQRQAPQRTGHEYSEESRQKWRLSMDMGTGRRGREIQLRERRV